MPRHLLKHVFSLAGWFLLITLLPAQVKTEEPSLSKPSNVEKPKLVVGIVVDQMRYDYLSRFSAKYGDGGFNRILAQGYACNNHFIDYIPTNTAPGHASIYTGTTPRNHGIMNNSWFDREKNEVVYCVHNPDVEPVGTGSSGGRKSPIQLLANTLGDQNRIYTQMRGKTVSISIKDRAAVLSGGFSANAAYWFRGMAQGSWISSSYYMERLPKWVQSFNDSNNLQKYMREWSTFFPIQTYIESGPDSTNFERGFKGNPAATFPYNLPELALENGEYDIIKSTPFGNSYTIDFALAALKGEALGKDLETDMLLISLSSTDYIGHNFGVTSKEVEDAYVRLDRDLAFLLTQLDSQVGKDAYTLFLTSDHGANEVPNSLLSQGLKAGYFKEASFKIAVKDFVKKTFGITEIIQNISGNQVYLNREMIANLSLDISEVEKSIQYFIEDNDQVKLALTRTQLQNKSYDEGLEQIIQNGFNLDRSGDIIYILEPAVVIYSHTGSSHGSPYSFDTHVPLLFYGNGITNGATDEPTFISDIAATIATLLQIPPPNKCTGSPIEAVLK